MLTRERQTLIRSRLDAHGRVVAAELSVEFEVSEDTIRRDLRELAAAGLCERVYGGALLRTPPVPLGLRLDVRLEAKRTLGRMTASLLEEGSVVFIDAGSTNLEVARAIAPGLRLTVVTNGPVIAAALIDRPHTEVIMVGGRMNADLGACVDAQALTEIGRLNIDAYVIGACGIDPAAGLMAQSFEEGSIKRAIAARSGAILAPVTTEKFTVRAPFAVSDITDDSTLIVEADAPEAALSRMRAQGARIVACRGDAG
ncbi:DeoR family transcriptional regulator [Hoeflea marina]|uniref:DeoR family transcriptional regulator n=2 Tax=Hoeflea marina TaxID=274592 RepID=A0A317PGF0_9HYPH|nr:DeoR family transcriptional regulator [Hoeflea marina]